jgi:heptaprenyl diphosphate synthase
MKINPFKSTARYVALTGIMLALAAALTAFESMASAFLPAGVRIGLSNIAVFTAAVCINLPTAFIITLLKSVFVLMTRGVTAGVMSASGGLLAFVFTALLLSHTKLSYVMISVVSAAAHIVGQLCAAAVITGSVYTLYYAPVLLIAGVASGFFTGVVSGKTIPILKGMLQGNYTNGNENKR